MSETEIKGILGTKLGMTQVFDEDNRVVPVTVVEAGPCVVTQIRIVETDGYTAIQIAYGDIDPRKVNKPAAGHFNKAGVTPRRHVAEIRMDDVSGYEVGQEVTAAIFHPLATTRPAPMAMPVREVYARLGGDSGLEGRATACARGSALLEHQTAPHRVLHPLKRVGPRGSTHWIPTLE